MKQVSEWLEKMQMILAILLITNILMQNRWTNQFVCLFVCLFVDWRVGWLVFRS